MASKYVSMRQAYWVSSEGVYGSLVLFFCALLSLDGVIKLSRARISGYLSFMLKVEPYLAQRPVLC